jgi:alpha-L-fucosidase
VDRYAEFVAFDKSQLDEIQRQYNPDIVWLDAGWVGPGNGLQTLPMDEWSDAARAVNPGQLWVNRDGKVAEDYLTPENPPPDQVLSFGLGLRPKPWEVCMTLGRQWAYTKNDT